MKAYPPELPQLLGAYCNGVLTPKEREELNQILRTSSDARRYYCDYIGVHLTLLNQARHGGSLQRVDLVELETTSLVQEVDIDQSQQASASRISFWAASACLTGLAAALLLWLGGALIAPGVTLPTKLASSPETSTTPNVPSAKPGPATIKADKLSLAARPSEAPAQDKSPPLYIAQISGISSDVAWEEASVPAEFLLRIRRGDSIELSKGLVQISYYSGASIILRGPCVYFATGERSGRLEKGWLTGNVTEGDFLLTTPTAKVIDLGTEFGVTVHDTAETDVCVFDGKVQVVAEKLNDESAETLLLEQGMAARIARGGDIAAVANVNSSQFTRSLPETPSPEEDPSQFSEPQTLSLVNLLSGSRSTGYRLAGVIAADTGNSDRRSWLRSDGPGYTPSNGFQSTEWHPFVNGVFIPTSKGRNVQIDTAGNTIDLPPSTGRTWGPVWSRRRIAGQSSVGMSDDYWGTDTLQGVIKRLQQCQTGMIGLHSNVGVTFDLRKISRHHGLAPTEFRGVIANLDYSQKRYKTLEKIPEHTPIDPRFQKYVREGLFAADVRVFVDGKLRASHLGFKRTDGELTISAKIINNDQFLTILSTDAGAGVDLYADAYDHVVLIDPVLVFSQ